MTSATIARIPAAALTSPAPIPQSPASLRYSGHDGDWVVFEVPGATVRGKIHYTGFVPLTGETRCTCPGARGVICCWHQRHVETAYAVWQEELRLRALDDDALRTLERDMRPTVQAGAASNDTLAIWDALGNEIGRRSRRAALAPVAGADLFGGA